MTEITTMIPKKTEFQEKLSDFIDADMDLDAIIEQTDSVEDFFLTVKNARQMWHGAAYGKLTKNADKKAYRERYGLSNSDAKDMAKTVEWMLHPTAKNASAEAFLADDFPSLSFSHFRLTAPLLKIDFDKGVELLQKAEDEGMTRDEVYAESLDIRQAITLEDRAQRIKKNNPGMKIADARAKAEANDKKDRLKKAAAAKLKAYNKAKEVIEEYESKGQLEDGSKKIVSASDADAALKVLYRFASKAAHEDAGGSNSDMVDVNAARDSIEQFINTWR